MDKTDDTTPQAPEPRKDAPPKVGPNKDEDQNQNQSPKNNDNGEYRYTDWASI